MGKYKVIVAARSFGASDSTALELLTENNCEVKKLTEADGSIKEQLERELPDADAVIAGLEEYDKYLLERGGNLKVISRYGVGYDNVDVAAAEKGIAVTITPGANGDAVADMAMSLMLACARNVSFMDSSIKSGNQKRPSGEDMWGKKLLGL